MQLLFLIFIVADQITKAVFANRDFSLLFMDFHLVRNFGLPLGVDLGQVWNSVILCVVYLAVAWLVYRWPNQGQWTKWGKALLWAGAASNLADRLVYGFVRDFIDIHLGFVFNLADAFIVLGIVCLLIPVAWQNMRK